MGIKDRIMQYLEYKGISPTKAEQMLKWGKGALIKANSISADKASEFLLLFNDLSAEWLLRGSNKMLQESGVSIQGNNKIGDVANSSSNINKNTINVALPENGKQKIIKPDGTVELTSGDSSNSELDDMKRYNESLKQEISHLNNNMKVKDDLIASLKETIELLKHRQ